jgi:4-hydroxybutyryl-CoA dehydratase/vinylacetyl-CoA-Delta-isomerase
VVAETGEDDIIRTGRDYIASLRGRGVAVYLSGKRVEEPVDHPIIRPSVNAVAATYDASPAEAALATAESGLTGEPVNRFLHVAQSAADLVAQGKMQRRLGQMTGTCFQRCVGMDAINSLFSLTYEIDAARGTAYHPRFRDWLAEVQRRNLVVGGAMTDVKGDRSKGPARQADPDLFVHVVDRRPEGIVIRGAKAHQTGAVNSHWLLVMPGQRLEQAEGEYAVACAVRVTAPGLAFIYGRQAADTRSLEGGLDVGNARYAGQEALVVFDDVFVPNDLVFLNGEVEYAADLVERFTAYHRRSYVCKTGVGDVLIGAAALIADYNGVPHASHVRDKLVEMAHLNETMYAAGIAASHEGRRTPAGNWEPDHLLANVCKQNVTRFPYEMARLAQDLAGGAVVTLPSEQDLRDPQIGPLLDKYLRGRADVPTEHRIRVLRLIENLTLGRNAVGFLTESLHGAGSPEAQRVVIRRKVDLDSRRALARRLAGIPPEGPA